MARVSAFVLKNFRSYQEATLSLGNLTLLVGANASGKSNFIEGLQMLSWLAAGQRLEDVFRAVQDSEMSIRGQPTHLARNGGTQFGLACRLRLAKWNKLTITVESDGNGLHVSHERIFDDSERLPLYDATHQTDNLGHDLSIAYNNFSRGGKKPQITGSDQQAVFTQLQTPARFAASHAKAQTQIPQTCTNFIYSLRNMLFLDPSPRRMRNVSFSDDKKLRGDGSNLSSTLYSLSEYPAIKAMILEFIRDLPEQHITDMKFLSGPRNDVLVQLEETFGSVKTLRDASLLSDGTLRVLAVAAALLSAPEYSTVVIEEIDNG